MKIARYLSIVACSLAVFSALCAPVEATPACNCSCADKSTVLTLDQRIDKAVDYIRTKTDLESEYALVLGSGFNALAEQVSEAVRIPYRDIPGFNPSTAPGHRGELVLGTFEGKKVCVMNGRLHLYEGLTAQQVVFPIQVMRALGASKLIVTNSSGAIRNDLALGDLLLIKDHINMMGVNPCVGPNSDKVGPRFFPMTGVYDVKMRRLAYAVAEKESIKLQEGVYVGMLGPSYETPAENRFLHNIGGDVVGMSTVLEVIEGAHCGMSVFGVSCVSDVLNDDDSENMEQEVLSVGRRASDNFIKLIRGMFREL